MTQSIQSQCQLAFNKKNSVEQLSTEKKNTLLHAFADALVENQTTILDANQRDITAGINSGLTKPLQDRLNLSAERIKDIAESIMLIASLNDPIGTELDAWDRPNGLHIQKIRVPLGCIGMIYEARPNVTADAIAIAIKTGNAMVLRGSASAYQTNRAIVDVITACCKELNIDPDFIQLLENTERSGVQEFVKMNQYLNLVIPRGGSGLIQSVVQNATVPTIETGVGLCHVYVDAHADLEKAVSIADNAKTHRPSVCNACETLLIHNDVATAFLPKIAARYLEKGVLIRGCGRTAALIDQCEPATDTDWDTEYLAMEISIKIVDSIEEALSHICTHGTTHTEAIITEDQDAIDLFSSIDASTIIINASTRFTDGGEFGFGAEIGISTQKLHARGPMGINELTSYKYIVKGNGQVR